MTRSASLMLALLCSFAAGSLPSPAAQILLPIETDAYLDSAAANANVNFGSNGSVRVLANGTDGSFCRGLFQLPPQVAAFDTNKLGKAVVSFYLFSDRTEGRNVSLFPLARPFDEHSATWFSADASNAWSSAGGDFDTNFFAVASRGADGFFRWDVTDLLLSPAARSNLLAHGALLRIDEEPLPSGMPRAPFSSSDSANPAERPFLQLSVRPQFSYPIETDAYLDSAAANANVNFGSNGSVRVLANGTDGSFCRGLFQLPPQVAAFDTNKLGKAVVSFYLFSDRTEGRNVSLFPLARPFDEHSATWFSADASNAWSSAGGDFDTNFFAVASRGADGFFRWDVTDLLLSPAARSNLLAHGALLRIDEEPLPSGMPRAPFSSSDSANPAERPFVQIIATARASFPIVDDAHVDSRDANMNFGAASAVKVVVNAATNLDGSVSRGLFKLPPEISALSPDDVDSVEIVFFASRDLTGDRPVTLYPLSQPFATGTGNGSAIPDGASWFSRDGSNAWSSAGGDFDPNRGVEAVKAPLFDPDVRSRFFIWDVTDLIRDPSSRSNLLANGAILLIDESRPRFESDVDDMPRAPFNSSENPDVAFRPFVRVALVARQPSLPLFSTVGDSVALGLGGCTPFVSYRIESSPDLAAPVWAALAYLVSTNGAIEWTGSRQIGWSNAYFRVVAD